MPYDSRDSEKKKKAPLRLALIYGSARNGRFCDTIVDWVQEEVRRHGGFEVDLVDPARAAASALQPRIEAADAFIVVTPEYNHGYPAPLKALLDAFYTPWHAKPFAFVSYGGVSGGLRAVEQLRQVVAELHATSIRDTVSFVNPWDRFDEDGRLREPEAAHRAAALMLARLHWWALILRDARRVQPYAKVANDEDD